ncbi:MAG TPA: winged helix-turn-helix domain-containing protein [Candidatus Thermoplasmatota archaeon]
MVSTVTQRPRSARELSIVLGIPVSRTYRRIKRLEKEGVLAVRDRVPSGYGKRENLYESRLRGFEIRYEVGSLEVRMEIEGREPIVARQEFREEILAKLSSPMFEALGGPEAGDGALRAEPYVRASPSA